MQENLPGKQFTDSAMQTGLPTGLHLFLHLSYEGLNYLVFHPGENRVYASGNYEGILNQVHFDQVFQKDPMLKATYAKVKVMFSNPHFTFIPDELFDAAAISTYLNFNLLEPDSYFQERNNVRALGAQTIFCVSREPKIVVNKYHPTNSVFHSSTPLLQGILTEYPVEGHRIFIFASSLQEIEIIVVRNGKLLLYNFFQVNTEEEFIYFPLYVAQQLELNRDQMELLVGGVLDLQHPWTALLKPYFRNIRPLEFSVGLQSAARVKERSGTLAWPLAWLASCES